MAAVPVPALCRRREVLTIKALSSSGLCLIVALAAGCSFDASQLRALPDGAVEPPAVPDASAAGSGGNTASATDAPVATGGSGGSIGTGEAGATSATSGAGGIGGMAAGGSGANGGSTAIVGTGGANRTDAGADSTGGGSGGTPACTPPLVPINVVATPDPNDATSGNIYVSWAGADSGSTPTGYTLLRGTSANGPFTAASTNQTPAKYTDFGTSLNLLNLNGTTYYYEVYASNAGGTCVSGNSAPVSAVSCSSPTIPVGVKATAGISRVTVSWTASTNGPTSYQVKRSTSATGTFTSLGTVTASPYVDSAVTNGTTYYYEVAARNANGVCSSANSGVSSTAPRSCTLWSGNAVNAGHPGPIGTTNGICYVTCDTITAWGCANTDGRTITINGVPLACSAGPIPAPKTAGYNVIDVTAGTSAQATIFWGGTWANACSIPAGGLDF